MLGIRTKWVSPIGLDIGQHSIKMLQLERHQERLRVRGAAKERLPAQIRDQAIGGYRRYHFVADSIRQMMKSSSFKGRDVIVSMPKNSYDYAYICLPEETLPLSDSLFLQQVHEQLGLSEESSQIDTFPSGQVREGNELSQQYLVFGMCDEAWLEQRMMLDDIRFEYINPDPIPCAFYRNVTLSHRDPIERNRTVVGVDIGGSSSTVIILNNTNLCWVRHIGIGGQDWTRPIVKKFHITPDEALQLRMRSADESSDSPNGAWSQPGRDQVDRVLVDIIRGKVEDLAREIKLGLEYYGRRYQAQPPQEILVFGGEAACSMVLRLLERILKMKVRKGRCFDGISLESGEIQHLSEKPFSEWSTAIGLCLKPKTPQKLSVPV